MIPARRIGSIDDIVGLALFVLSDAGANLNGAILVSDGGLCLTAGSVWALTPGDRVTATGASGRAERTGSPGG